MLSIIFCGGMARRSCMHRIRAVTRRPCWIYFWPPNYDCVVMEGTFGLGAECEGHMCLHKNIQMRDLLTKHGCWAGESTMYLTHICPHWAPPHDEYAAVVAEEGMVLGYDGQSIEI